MVPHAIVIGSANTETVLLVPRKIVLGGKLTFRLGADGIGGSAVNWTRWLHAAGMTLDVLCPIGNDSGGAKIRELLNACGVTPGFGCDLELADDSDDGRTPHSYILVTDESRTVLSSQSATRRHLDDVGSRIHELAGRKPFQAAMIGNVPTDQSGPVDTRAILDAMPDGVFVYANGRAQFRHSREAWGDSIDRIHCFQFALHEAKPFADVLDNTSGSSLDKALQIFSKHRLNVIVTLGRMGAVSVFGQVPQLSEIVFLTWPMKPEPPVSLRSSTGPSGTIDPTGAGDAFGAGFLASIAHDLVRDEAVRTREQDVVKEVIVRALDTGALLGSWACCGLGGVGICPSERGSIAPWIGRKTGATSTRTMDLAANLLYALDK